MVVLTTAEVQGHQLEHFEENRRIILHSATAVYSTAVLFRASTLERSNQTFELLTGYEDFAYGAAASETWAPSTLEAWHSTFRSTNYLGLIAFMFRIGIVGHRYLTNAETIAFVADQSLAALKQAQANHSDVVALSAIAEGADTLFAEAALALDIPLEIVRPFADYAADFETFPARKRYEELRVAARCEVRLTYQERSNVAYEAAMNWIVRRSDLLLVAWDGLPTEGAGGTGDAVKQAVQLNTPWLHLNVTDLSAKAHAAGPNTRQQEMS